MPQSSAPLVGVNLSDADWRDSFGDEAGVLGDLDGSAYKVTLPTDSDTIQVGSTTQRSIARVAGFVHRIPAGEAEALTIPAASGSARTDIVALRYDPAFTGPPGPARLVRIAGTSAGLPAYDAAPPGVEDLPLWSITRQPGQALSQATVTRLFPRLAPVLEIAPSTPLPTSSPLGTVLRRGDEEFRRVQDANGVAVWINGSTLARLRLTATDDASATSTDHPFQIGPDNGLNIIIDGNEVLGRNNGAPAKIGFGHGISVLPEPVSSSDAATKNYVDELAARGTWQNVTYASGYAKADATRAAQGMTIDGGAAARLRGGIKRINDTPHGAAVFPIHYGTLPAALRPTDGSRWVVAHGTGGTAALLEIETSGRIMLKDTTNRNVTYWFALDGITYDL